MKTRFLALTVFVAAAVTASSAWNTSVSLKQIGNFRTGIFAQGASEISAFDPFTQRLFSVNAYRGTVDIIDLKDPSQPSLLFSIDLAQYGKAANSVAVCNGLLAVAVENENKQAPGKLLVFCTWGNCKLLFNTAVGALPDMVTFTPNGRYILVANEGEPNDDYTVDPEGSVSIIDVWRGAAPAAFSTVDFSYHNTRKNELQTQGIRIFGPNATVAQDFEPEYIAVSHDSKTAWVTLQENNAVAVISISQARIDTILPLGSKDHLSSINAFDASDKDGMIYPYNWPVNGLYLPDAIVTFKHHGKNYFLTANEGDAREYAGFAEVERVKKMKLDPVAFPQAADLKQDQNLGRLKVTTIIGDTDADGDFDKLYSFGGRSFAIWNEEGRQIFESGSLLEKLTAELEPDAFNSDHEENNSFDSRSDDKGPEPEGIAMGTIRGVPYAFIGLERMSSIVVFDLSDPSTPRTAGYVTTRRYDGTPAEDSAGDLGPEGLTFVPAYASPTRKPLLIVSYEISGSISIFEVEQKGKCKAGMSEHHHR